MATDKNTIKKWFVNGAKPTQEQFWNWIDSFWHKDEAISQNQIEGLSTSLEGKADASALELKANVDASGLTAEQIAAWQKALGIKATAAGNPFN